jgi:hypothetical protein
MLCRGATSKDDCFRRCSFGHASSPGEKENRTFLHLPRMRAQGTAAGIQSCDARRADCRSSPCAPHSRRGRLAVHALELRSAALRALGSLLKPRAHLVVVRLHRAHAPPHTIIGTSEQSSPSLVLYVVRVARRRASPRACRTVAQCFVTCLLRLCACAASMSRHPPLSQGELRLPLARSPVTPSLSHDSRRAQHV